jgi:hypothetical protein
MTPPVPNIELDVSHSNSDFPLTGNLASLTLT